MSVFYPMAFVVEPGKIAFRDHTPPEIGPQDVKIKVRAVAICGSDLHIFKGKHPSAPLPAAVGHEICGQVVACGPAVERLAPGDRVAIEPVIVCGRCHFCMRGQYHLCTKISFQYRVGQGGITPYFVAHENWCHRLPDNLSDREGALMEPLSVAVHAVKNNPPLMGEPSAIFGAGAIGLLALQVLRQAGGDQVFMVDVNAHRLAAALDLGATKTFNNLENDAVGEILAATGGLGVARAYEAVGLQITLVQALQVLRKGGAATLLGIFEQPEVSLPANLFVQKEVSLHGSQGYNWDFQTAVQLASRNQVDLKRLITHTFAMDRAQEAFETLLDPGSQAVKVVITLDD